MKPKKRKEQKQTSRMVLRNHDHRDAIFDQKYHNMIFLNKSEKRDEKGHVIEEGYSDYAWIKFPYNAFLTLGPDHKIGWMDADRQFHYASNAGQGGGINTYSPERDNAYYYFDDFIMRVHRNSNYDRQIGFGYDLYVSRDGVRWYTVNAWTYFNGFKVNWPLGEPGDPILLSRYLFNSGSNPYNLYKLGEWKRCASNGVAFLSNPGASSSTGPYTVCDLFTFSLDEKFNLGVTHVRATVFQNYYDKYHETDIYEEGVLIGTSYYKAEAYIEAVTRTGVIIKKDIRTYTSYIPGASSHTSTASKTYNFFHLTWEGGWSIKEVRPVDPGSTPPQYLYNYNAYAYLDDCRHGDTTVTVYVRSQQIESNKFYVSIMIGYTANNGDLWEYYEPIYYTITGQYTNIDAKAKVIYRNAKFYVFLATPNQDGAALKLYSSTNGYYWNEIALPRWLDIPYTDKCGLNTDRDPAYEYLRLAVKPLETSDQDANIYDLIWYDPVRFKNGEINDRFNEFYICFYNPIFAAYFTNEYLATNSEAFAWLWKRESTSDVNSIYDIGEEVMDYDYCAPPGGFEGEVPDIDNSRIFYVWDFTNLEFILVDRHLSTYANYQIVLVDELPPTGEANTLYGIPMDINKLNIYEYYIWNSNEFVSVQNLTLYSGYTKVVVQSLPYVGALNVIYAVPLDYSAYTSNMYIWNPDFEMFEDLNTTTYDMSDKRYNTVNVRQLPDVGRVGIIYISEQRYTPHSVTHEDNTYNYYQWDIIDMQYRLVSPIINQAKYNIIEVTELPPYDPSTHLNNSIWKIPKELDGHDTHDYYESESKLKEFLESHFDRHAEFLYSKDQLPLVGVMNIYYVVKETPGQFSGKYTVYLWNTLTKKYDVHSEYDYFISEDPEDPKPVRFVNIVFDNVFNTNTGE